MKEVAIHLADRMFTVREVRPYNAFKAAMLLAKYIRKSEPAMLLVFRWIAARENRDPEMMIKMAMELWDLLEPELTSAMVDVFPLLELLTGIPADFLKDEPTVPEVVELTKKLYALNDMVALLSLAKDVSIPKGRPEQPVQPTRPEPKPKAPKKIGLGGDVRHVEVTEVTPVEL